MQHEEMAFDRTVGEELLTALRKSPMNAVLARRATDTGIFDVQLRSAPKGKTDWATLYYGLTSILDIDARNGKFRLRAHDTHKVNGGFDSSWSTWQPSSAIEAQWPQVETYLDRVIPTVNKRHTGKEGRVHAALSSGESDAYRIINRETSPSFADDPTRNRVKLELQAPIERALAANAPRDAAWWPSGVSVGTSPDFLAVDIGGRLVIIEAKHHSATEMIAKVALQVGFYARMFARLIAQNARAVPAMQTMLEQRVDLGLARKGRLYLTRPTRVVPVIAIGPGRPTKDAHSRLWAVANAVSEADAPPGVDPVEVWYVDEKGRIIELERPADVA